FGLAPRPLARLYARMIRARSRDGNVIVTEGGILAIGGGCWAGAPLAHVQGWDPHDRGGRVLRGGRGRLLHVDLDLRGPARLDGLVVRRCPFQPDRARAGSLRGQLPGESIPA